MRFIEKSFLTLSLVFTNNIISMFFSIFLARILPTESYGALQTLYGFTALAFNIINFGIINATSKHILHSKNKKEYAFNGLILTLGVSITCLLIGLFFINPLSDFLKISNEYDFLLYLLFPLILFNLGFYFFTRTLTSLGKTLAKEILNMLNNLIYVLPIILVFLIYNFMEIEFVMFFRILSFVLISIFMFYFIFKKLKVKLSFKKIKKIIKTSKETFNATLIVVFVDNLTKPILGLISLEDVAYYSVALTYSKIVTIFQTGVKNILFSIVGSLAVKKKFKKIQKGINLLFDIVLKLILPISIILIIISEDVINLLYSARYSNASFFVFFTIIGSVLNLLSLPESAIFYGLNKLKDRNKYNLLRSFFYLPILLVLTSLFSGLGATISYLILSLLNLVFFMYFIKKYGFKLKLTKPYSVLFPFLILAFQMITGLNIISIILLLIFFYIVIKKNIISKSSKNLMIKKAKERKIPEFLINFIK